MYLASIDSRDLLRWLRAMKTSTSTHRRSPSVFMVPHPVGEAPVCRVGGESSTAVHVSLNTNPTHYRKFLACGGTLLDRSDVATAGELRFWGEYEAPTCGGHGEPRWLGGNRRRNAVRRVEDAGTAVVRGSQCASCSAGGADEVAHDAVLDEGADDEGRLASAATDAAQVVDRPGKSPATTTGRVDVGQS
jgi:hypothetical protein